MLETVYSCRLAVATAQLTHTRCGSYWCSLGETARSVFVFSGNKDVKMYTSHDRVKRAFPRD